jgi:hypothetical protein
MILCDSCGAIVPTGRFCKHCGQRLTEAPPAAVGSRSRAAWPAWAWVLAGVIVLAAAGAVILRARRLPPAAGPALPVDARRPTRPARDVVANEQVVVGDIRTVISAEAAYQASNGGYYDAELSCLSSPVRCIPGYPPNAPTFLDRALASATPQSGYAREFHAGPLAPNLPAFASPHSVLVYAYTAVPTEPGRTGVRSFCGDSSGVVVFCADGRRPPVSNASCHYDAVGCGILR